MENPQIIASVSFSYSWLTIDRTQPSFDVSNPIVNHHLDNDFNFDIPLCNKSHVSLVDANDIFSDGYMIPSSFFSPLRTPSTPITPSNDRGSSQTKLLKKWMKSSTKFLNMFSWFLIPRKSNKVNDLGRKESEVHRWGASLKTPPTDSMQGQPSNPAGKSSYDVNSDAIKEAILHCKKGIEVKDNDLTKEEKDVIILDEDENELITTSRKANGDLVSNSKRKNLSDVSFHNHELPGNVVPLDENRDIEVHDLGSQESDIASVNSKNHKHNQNKNVIDDCMVDFQPIQPLFYITKENASTLPVALPCDSFFFSGMQGSDGNGMNLHLGKWCKRSKSVSSSVGSQGSISKPWYMIDVLDDGRWYQSSLISLVTNIILSSISGIDFPFILIIGITSSISFYSP